MSIHDGHRARLKREFMDHGEQAFSDQQLLELLLCYAIPQGDVCPLAAQLMNRFGSLAGVLDAEIEELKKVNGIGEHTALLLSVLPQIFQRYALSRTKDKTLISTSSDAGEYLLPYFIGAKTEILYLLSLDSGGRILDCSFIAQGGSDQVELNFDLITQTAQKHHAGSIILAHNHTNGVIKPSRADIELSSRLSTQLKSQNILLLDHIVVADGEYLSMAESGMLQSETT